MEDLAQQIDNLSDEQTNSEIIVWKELYQIF